MNRSQSLARVSATAFDFDVVTDVSARPLRKPDATDVEPPERAALREKSEPAKA